MGQSASMQIPEGRAMRTSDRVFLEIAIMISGSDSEGREFVERTRSLVLSRRGARICSRETLLPEQELAIRCLKTGRQAQARVVGLIMKKEEGSHYGIAFLDPEENIWGISFPTLDGTENPAGRMFLECSDCHAQEVVHLDVFELEVFLLNAAITRPCPSCSAITIWTRAAAKEAVPPSGPASQPSRRTKQERKSPRVSLKVAVCLHHAVEGQDIVTTENVSRGGFRYRSAKNYPLGTHLEAALPYSPGAANIFTPVKVVHKELALGANEFFYSVAYIPSPAAPSLTGLRITQPAQPNSPPPPPPRK